jgi:hypothetical protein
MNIHLTAVARMRASNFVLKAALLALFIFAPLYGRAQSNAGRPLPVHNIVLVHGRTAPAGTKSFPFWRKRAFTSRQCISLSPRWLRMQRR